MAQDVKDYPTADEPPEAPQFFCPFATIYESGPAGSWIKKMAPCDTKNCALGSGLTDLCSVLHMCNMIEQAGACVLQLRPALEKIAPILEHLSSRLEAILLQITAAKMK